MNEKLSKLLNQLKELWSKWSTVQKGILIGIVVVAIGAIIAISRLSASPTSVPLFSTEITDQAIVDQIVYRLAEENVESQVSATGVISVKDEATARRMRSLLVREDLVPGNVDPWELFDTERWTTTDFERNVNLRRSITNTVQQHIEALDDVDKANVVITMPEDKLFAEDQKEVTASVILYSKPGSDITTNRKKIEGIQKLILRAVEGLKAENITISDSAGNIINDFEGMAELDRVTLVEKQQKLIAQLESTYRAKILAALQSIYTNDRVRDLNIKIDMDMSKRESQKTEYSPFVLKEDNPDTPYDDSEYKDGVVISEEIIDKVYKGTGYNPEGPAGVEGQNPPVYSDMSNLYGVSTEKGEKRNYVYNEEHITSEKSPEIDSVSVSVNIDGSWKMKYDEKGNPIELPNGTLDREYVAISDAELEQATRLVQGAVGYQASRGDTVTVVNIQYDRSSQFAEDDAAYFRQKQTRLMLFWSVVGVAAILIAFILFRIISREMDRRRRQREEELLRKHQMERERTLLEAEQAGMEVSMSVEERKRMELQENAITMAKEHPEDVALLIRTWLMEE